MWHRSSGIAYESRSLGHTSCKIQASHARTAAAAVPIYSGGLNLHGHDTGYDSYDHVVHPRMIAAIKILPRLACEALNQTNDTQTATGERLWHHKVQKRYHLEAFNARLKQIHSCPHQVSAKAEHPQR